MKHAFLPSAADKAKCNCGRSEVDHTERATCDACGNTCGLEGTVIYGKDLLLCPACFELEKKAMEVAKLQVPAAEIIRVAKVIDTSIQIREDIFNAETVSIKELQDAIGRDDNIKEKHFTLSKAIEERFNHFTEVLNDFKKQQTELLSKQRALQTFYQDLAKQLTIEQRESIKLKDLNYKPEPPKLVKAKPLPTKKFDLNQLKLAANESGISLGALQAVCISRNVSAIEAVRILKELGM